MRKSNFVSVGVVAFFLGSLVASVGCGDDDGGAGGAGGSPASSSSSGSSSSSSGGGSDGGSGGQGGTSDGGSGGQGGGGACKKCSEVLLSMTHVPDDEICETSKPKVTAIRTCICTACGATAADPCNASCTTMADTDQACKTCGQTAALGPDGACKPEGAACLGDTGTN